MSPQIAMMLRTIGLLLIAATLARVLPVDATTISLPVSSTGQSQAFRSNITTPNALASFGDALLMPSIEVIKYTTTVPPPQRVMHVKLPDSRVGDVIDFAFILEVTNDTGPIVNDSAVEFACKVILSQSGSGNVGINVSTFPGKNVDRNVHHDVLAWVKYGISVPWSGDVWVALVCYAGGGNYWQAGDRLTLEPSGADASARRFR